MHDQWMSLVAGVDSRKAENVSMHAVWLQIHRWKQYGKLSTIVQAELKTEDESETLWRFKIFVIFHHECMASFKYVVCGGFSLADHERLVDV